MRPRNRHRMTKAAKTKFDQPSVERFLAWHTKSKICDGWTQERFNRLCKLLHMTPREMAAFIGVVRVIRPKGKPPMTVLHWDQMYRWLSQDRIPPYVALVLQGYEDEYLRRSCGLEHEPLAPSHIPSHD